MQAKEQLPLDVRVQSNCCSCRRRRGWPGLLVFGRSVVVCGEGPLMEQKLARMDK